MEDIFKRIAVSESLEQLCEHLVPYATGRGFGGVFYFAYDQGRGFAGEAPNKALIHGFHPDVVRTYLKADHRRLDVMPRLTLTTGKPVRWSEGWGAVSTTEEEQGFLAMMREVEIGDGFGFPCYGPGGRNAYVGVGVISETARTDELAVREMHLVAQAVHVRICALTESEQPPAKALSTREREILLWVARGKSNGVIADILAISPGTVDTYLRRIYDKLGVSDRTSAAVRGIGMGVIAA